MVARRRRRYFIEAVMLLLWCGWAAVASADDCVTRAACIAAGRCDTNDPDCKKGGIVAAATATTVAGATIAIAAVSLGLGLAGAGAGAVGGAAAGGLLGGLGFPGGGPAGGAGPGAGSPGGGPVGAGGGAGSTVGGPGAGGAGRSPAAPSSAAPSGTTAEQKVGAGQPRAPGPPRPRTPSQPSRTNTGRDPALSAPQTLRGPAAFSALERAGLAERVPGHEGVYRFRPDVQALGRPGAPSSGVTGIAYFMRADGTLDPNIAVGMAQGSPSTAAATQAAGTPRVSDSTSQPAAPRAAQPATEASPAGKADASASDASPAQKTEGAATHAGTEAAAAPGAEGVAGAGAEVVGRELIEEKIRHAVLELFSPGKLVGGRFHDIEHFREEYEKAKAIENSWESQQAQDYVVYRFVEELGVSEPAARTLLELPKAKWEPLATLIASVAH